MRLEPWLHATAELKVTDADTAQAVGSGDECLNLGQWLSDQDSVEPGPIRDVDDIQNALTCRGARSRP